MPMREMLISMILLVPVACGGGENAGEGSGTGTGVADGEAAVARDEGPASTEQLAEGPGGLVLTEVPDPCDYFTQADAEAVMGEATGSGKSYDAGGWNCVYDTAGDQRRRLVFDMYVGRGDDVEDTQIGMTIEACAAEVVAEYDDLGRDAALYRQTAAHCNGGYFLWVLTNARFEGRLRPEFERDSKGPVHFLVSASPAGSRQQVSVLLRDAARRALDRLQ